MADMGRFVLPVHVLKLAEERRSSRKQRMAIRKRERDRIQKREERNIVLETQKQKSQLELANASLRTQIKDLEDELEVLGSLAKHLMLMRGEQGEE